MFKLLNTELSLIAPSDNQLSAEKNIFYSNFNHATSLFYTLLSSLVYASL